MPPYITLSGKSRRFWGHHGLEALLKWFSSGVIVVPQCLTSNVVVIRIAKSNWTDVWNHTILQFDDCEQAIFCTPILIFCTTRRFARAFPYSLCLSSLWIKNWNCKFGYSNLIQWIIDTLYSFREILHWLLTNLQACLQLLHIFPVSVKAAFWGSESRTFLSFI